VLDDGRLTDGKGRTVNFKNTILIMTSNVGADIIQDYMSRINESNKTQMMAECKEKVMAILKKSIRPEFLNRIDEIIMFQPLGKEEVKGILKLQINQIENTLKEKGIALDFTESALNYLANKGYDIAYGARPIKRLLQKEVVNTLAEKLISGEISSGKKIKIDYKNNQLLFK
jgi:ATP-dependent Clp protease ATP-binding subunit ClpB